MSKRHLILQLRLNEIARRLDIDFVEALERAIDLLEEETKAPVDPDTRYEVQS